MFKRRLSQPVVDNSLVFRVLWLRVRYCFGCLIISLLRVIIRGRRTLHIYSNALAMSGEPCRLIIVVFYSCGFYLLKKQVCTSLIEINNKYREVIEWQAASEHRLLQLYIL